MKLFSDYLKLVESEEKKKGTYSSFQLSDNTSKKLHNWLEKYKIENLVEIDKYHVTVTYSRKAVPEISKLNPKLPIKVKAIGWDIFGDDLLVLKLDSTKLGAVYDANIDMGATSDYDEYIPHISVAANYTGELPKEVPAFLIVLEEYIVEELDLDYSYDEE